jgi:hypothetical protein
MAKPEFLPLTQLAEEEPEIALRLDRRVRAESEGGGLLQIPFVLSMRKHASGAWCILGLLSRSLTTEP